MSSIPHLKGNDMNITKLFFFGCHGNHLCHSNSHKDDDLAIFEAIFSEF